MDWIGYNWHSFSAGYNIVSSGGKEKHCYSYIQVPSGTI